MAELRRYSDPRVIVNNSEVKRDPVEIETGANKLLRITIEYSALSPASNARSMSSTVGQPLEL
jgi:hypothetical protein